MTEEHTLDLDVDHEPSRGSPKRFVRVTLASAFGFTRDGGAPTLTIPCTDLAAFDREVDRLEGELAALRLRGREEFGGSEATAEAPPAKPPSPTAQLAGRIETDLRVQDVMTRDVKTLHRNDRISMAEELMKVGRFRHVVVLDETERVAGIISQRDIFYGALAWSLGQGRIAHERTMEATLVKDVMRTEVVGIDPSASLSEAAAILMERKVGCLPVMEADRLVGILTEGDFLALLAPGAATG